MSTADQLGREWQRAMLAGDFERAWRASDRIRELGVDDPHRLWLGEEFIGKRVMVRCLHGLGDSVQFLRYVPLLNARSASVCVEVAPRFVELARHFIGVSDVITWGPDAPQTAQEWDVQVEVMEFPYVFRTHMDDLPLAVNYLEVDAAGQRPDRKLQVGVAWTAGDWNPERGIALTDLRPLLAIEQCVFWSLGSSTADSAGAMLEDVRCRESVMGLAKRIASLDLVITVDTLAAHLAGAMGIPAYVMLLHDADWRWMSTGESSPWYPSLRLFRQEETREWPIVVERVRLAVCELVDAREKDRRASDAVA